MPIYINGKKATAIKRNGVDYVKVYHGEKLVWSKRKKNEYAEFWEWLRADGQCYIDSGITPAYGQVIKGTMRYDRAEYFAMENAPNNLFIVTTDEKCKNSLCTGGLVIYQHVYQFLPWQCEGKVNHYILFRNNKVVEKGIDVVNMAMTISRTYSENVKSVSCSCYTDGVEVALNLIESQQFTPYLSTETFKIAGYPDFNGCHSVKGVQIGSHTYTPCKLIKELPASKAWDGNSHAAGECGMWDSVSDKFYGNANTSGTFTVSDED